MGSAFHQLCPRYSGTLTPIAPTATRLWETFTFTFFTSHVDDFNIRNKTLTAILLIQGYRDHKIRKAF